VNSNSNTSAELPVWGGSNATFYCHSVSSFSRGSNRGVQMLDTSHSQGNEQMHHGGAGAEDVDALSLWY